MKRTLEQVIMDASQELFGDGFGSGAVRRSEAVAIAAVHGVQPVAVIGNAVRAVEK